MSATSAPPPGTEPACDCAPAAGTFSPPSEASTLWVDRPSHSPWNLSIRGFGPRGGGLSAGGRREAGSPRAVEKTERWGEGDRLRKKSHLLILLWYRKSLEERNRRISEFLSTFQIYAGRSRAALELQLPGSCAARRRQAGTVRKRLRGIAGQSRPLPF